MRRHSAKVRKYINVLYKYHNVRNIDWEITNFDIPLPKQKDTSNCGSFIIFAIDKYLNNFNDCNFYNKNYITQKSALSNYRINIQQNILNESERLDSNCILCYDEISENTNEICSKCGRSICSKCFGVGEVEIRDSVCDVCKSCLQTTN